MIAAAVFLGAAIGTSWQAASVSDSVKHPPSQLAIVLTPLNTTIACSAAAGTVVSSISTKGGDGNTITLTMSGDTTDFALSGVNIVVAARGITSPNAENSKASL